MLFIGSWQLSGNITFRPRNANTLGAENIQKLYLKKGDPSQAVPAAAKPPAARVPERPQSSLAATNSAARGVRTSFARSSMKFVRGSPYSHQDLRPNKAVLALWFYQQRFGKADVPVSTLDIPPSARLE